MSLLSRSAGLASKFLIWTASSAAVRRAARALFRLLTPTRDIRLNFPGYPVYVRTPDRLIAGLLCKHALPSSLEAAVYRERVKPGMTVLEIGANVGFYTQLFGDLAGPSGRVLAFEPDPLNFRLLSRSVAEGGRANISCRQAAVTDAPGTAKLYIYEESRGDNCIYDCRDGRDFVEVEAVTVDVALGPGGRADFIKMDIQGAEYRALLGMEGTLKNSPGLVMLMEFSPALVHKAGDSPEALLRKLQECGFALGYLDEDSGAVKRASPEELIALCPGYRYMNLLLEKN